MSPYSYACVCVASIHPCCYYDQSLLRHYSLSQNHTKSDKISVAQKKTKKRKKGKKQWVIALSPQTLLLHSMPPQEQ